MSPYKDHSSDLHYGEASRTESCRSVGLRYYLADEPFIIGYETCRVTPTKILSVEGVLFYILDKQTSAQAHCPSILRKGIGFLGKNRSRGNLICTP